MSEKNNNYTTKTLTTPEGIKISYFDNKLHSWNIAAIRYTKEMKKKDEYYLYGLQKTKEEWIEFRQGRHGVPPDKNPQVSSRF